MKIKFPKNNKLLYSQDFSTKQGIPSDVEFEVTFLNKEKTSAKLVAHGYGVLGDPDPTSYGNGALYITKGSLNHV